MAVDNWRSSAFPENGGRPSNANHLQLSAQENTAHFVTTDVEAIQFHELDDGSGIAWVEALQAGDFNHPLYGRLSFNEERFRRFHGNFALNVRGAELDVDYDHKMDPAKGNKAAGWVRNVRFNADRLEYQIEFTKEAVEGIRNKEWRYFSSDFMQEWTDPRTGVKHKDVLCGGALTNRPFIKGMAPVNLSDLAEKLGVNLSQQLAQGDGGMDKELRAALLQKYGLADDATDAQIAEAVTKDVGGNQAATASGAPGDQHTKPWTQDQPKGTEGQGGPPQPTTGPTTNTSGDQLSEEQRRQLTELAKTNPALATLITSTQEALAQTNAQLTETNRRLAAQEAANRLSEVNIKLSSLGENSKASRAIPPVVLDMIKPVMLADTAHGDTIYKALAKLIEVGFVPLGETAPLNDNPLGGGDLFTQIEQKANKLLAENKELSFADAMDQVFLADPALAERWVNNIPSTPASAELP